MELSLLIPSLKTRAHYLARLRDLLAPQLTPEVEVLTEVDDGESSIGAKRNRLLARAAGTYVCGIDDDDIVAPTYVQTLLDALRSRPDAVTYFAEAVSDGKFLRLQRSTYHLSPVRADIARSVAFPNSNFGEDTAWNQRVAPLIHTEAKVLRNLYTYLYRSDRTGEVTNELRRPFAEKRRDFCEMVGRIHSRLKGNQ